MLQNLKKRTEGFTIIEVMIVLAIAALIMVVVLIAVPQLQRNQRNSARRDVIGRIKTELDNRAGNNNGKYPASSAELTSFVGSYLNGINVEDPSTGSAMSISYVTTTTLPTGNGNVSYFPSKVCNGENVTNGNSRNYALMTELEGGAKYCLDNK